MLSGAWTMFPAMFCDPQAVLEQCGSGLLLQPQDHFVEPLAPMKMRVDFYDTPPDRA